MAPAELWRKALAASVGLVVSFEAGAAGAFCRTTTCDPKIEICTKDSNKCVIDGTPLAWRDRCISFGTQQDGSPRRGISWAEADHAFQQAFLQWTRADCDGRHPSFEMWDFGPIVCAEPEFNDFLPNANVWMFRDKDWPYRDDTQTLALTTVLFERGSGVILDADVEINSFAMELSTSDTVVKRDLQSIATHEAGHFLGLSHTLVPGATMQAQYTAGDLDYRSIHDDDRQGICAVYPPDRSAPLCAKPHPPHGFSKYCGGGEHADPPPSGCSVGAPPAEKSGGGGAVIALCLALGRRRRRRDTSVSGR